MALTIDSKAGSVIKVTGTTATAEKIFDDKTHVKFIKWHKPTTEGHKLSVKNIEGSEIVIADCEKANQSQWLPIWGTYENFYIDDLDSGSVYIYIR